MFHALKMYHEVALGILEAIGSWEQSRRRPEKALGAFRAKLAISDEADPQLGVPVSAPVSVRRRSHRRGLSGPSRASMQAVDCLLDHLNASLAGVCPGWTEAQVQIYQTRVTFVIRSSRPRPYCDAYEVESTGASRKRSIRIGDHEIESRRSHRTNRRTAKWTRDFNRRRPPSPPAISRH
jgi:hypothetical protein